MKRLFAILLLIACASWAAASDPLVYVSSWNTGSNAKAVGQDLAAQLDRAKAGLPVLPVIQCPISGLGNSASPEALARLAAMGLPFSVRVNNAAEFTAEQVGGALQLLAGYVPNPPYVILIDNNEGDAADAMTAAQTLALHEGIKRMVPGWDLRVGGYDVGAAHYQYGRQWGTEKWFTGPIIESYWDGGSPSAMYFRWSSENDTTVAGPMSYAINVGWSRSLVSPHWWQELGCWTGGDGMIAKTGLTPARYQGMALWGAFVSDARVLRQFSASATPYATDAPWMEALYRAASSINDDPTVRRFMESGELLRCEQLSPLYRDRSDLDGDARQVLLPCSANPPVRDGESIWDLANTVAVWATARRMGDDEYLILVTAPMGAQNVTVSVPGLVDQHFDLVPPEGAFQYVDARPDVPTEPPVVSPWVDYDMQRSDGSIERIKLREVTP